MWYLISSTGKRIYLKPNKAVTFGRKKSDILLQNDESISRLHASICIEPKQKIKPNEPISVCKLLDVGSKYGTYILSEGNDDRIEVPQGGYSLKDQDKIRFGLQNHIFTVVYVPIITVVSTLSDNDKNKLQSIMNEIDGMISMKWTSNCTELTVSKATLTEKVVLAMASAIPIVTLNYWEAVKGAVNNGKELPKSEDFTPLIDESLVNKEVSLRPNNKRKTLFQNLIFVHFTARQYEIYGKMISMAGGKSLLYSTNPLNHKDLCAANVIVLQYPNNDTTQSTQSVISEYDSIYDVLKKNKRKLISESNIPLAILHSSVEKYCNPKFKFEEFLKRPQSKSDSSEILVLDTQDVTSDVRALPTIISDVPIKSDINLKKSTHATKIIPESYDMPSSKDLLASSNTWHSQGLITSTPKKNNEIRDILNSNTTVLKETVENAKEICLKKVTKYISETNTSSMPNMPQKDTQHDSLKIVDTGKVTKYIREANTSPISNITQKDSQHDSQKIVDSRKVTKCIPETNTSFMSNMTQKDTQRDSQKLVDPRKVTKYIPETNTSFMSNMTEQNIQRDSQKSIDPRKITKYIPETNTSSMPNITQKDTQRDSQKIVDSRKVTKCIPETNTSFMSNMTQKDNQRDSQKLVDPRKVTKYIPETSTSFMSNMTEQNIQRDSQKSVDPRKIMKYIPETNTSSMPNITQKDTQRDSQKLVDPRKVTKYIPETNTSFMSNMTEKDIQRDSQKIIHSKEKQSGTQNIEILKEAMIIDKGAPCNEVIDLSPEEPKSGVQSGKCNENVNRIPIMEDTLCKLLDVDNERDKSTEVDKNSLVKTHNEIRSKQDRHASQSTSSTIKEDNHQKSKKRKKDSCHIENVEIDDELPTSGKRKIHLEDLTVEDTAKSPKASSAPCNEEQENQSVCDNLLRSTTSLLRVSPNYKRFKKVYNNIPEIRITLNDMYVWERCNISGF